MCIQKIALVLFTYVVRSEFKIEIVHVVVVKYKSQSKFKNYIEKLRNLHGSVKGTHVGCAFDAKLYIFYVISSVF